MKKIFAIIFLIGGVILTLLSFKDEQSTRFISLKNEFDLNKLSVLDVLVELGDEKPTHYLKEMDLDSVKMGYEIVHFGQLKDKSNRKVSKFFVCTDCHNQINEVSDLSNETATERLKFGVKNDLPFLPASTFYGMYNKSHWYNGDYSKKYGDLVIPTRDSLDNAIQLCATQCSQGRELENWEIRTIIHYYKSIEIKVNDLRLTRVEKDLIIADLLSKNKRTIKMLKSRYNSINKATFGKLNPKEPNNYSPNLKNGEYIFKNGCLHCHGMGKDITNFEFDADNLTFSFLESKLKNHSNYSVPYIVRKGTYAISGRKQYMPQYPIEKMNNTQLFDLMNYIKSKK